MTFEHVFMQWTMTECVWLLKNGSRCYYVHSPNLQIWHWPLCFLEWLTIICHHIWPMTSAKGWNYTCKSELGINITLLELLTCKDIWICRHTFYPFNTEHKKHDVLWFSIKAEADFLEHWFFRVPRRVDSESTFTGNWLKLHAKHIIKTPWYLQICSWNW